MAAKVKTWVWVVVGIVAAGILCVVAIAGFAVFFFSRHIDTKTVSPAIAERNFAEIKARFADQKPLIELDTRGHFVRANSDRPNRTDTKAPHDLYVLAFDPDDGHIVRVQIPFWLLRLKMRGGTIDFNGRRMDLEDLRLSVEDLERFGPTLIVDHKTDSGERVLVWSQ